MKAMTTFWHWPDHRIGKRESRRLREEHNAAVSAMTSLLRYARLEADYSRLSDRVQAFSGDALVKWAGANGCDIARGEPIGAWLGRERSEAFALVDVA